jgi:D-alanine-D-alanine ligase
MKVAIVHNRRPSAADGQPADWYAEYDTPETIEALGQALRQAGFDPIPVEADRDLVRRLEAQHIDLVVNLAEGSGRRSREAIVPALCEFLNLPYTGSDPLTCALTLDKALARRVVGPDIPVARGDVLVPGASTDDLPALSYPVVVKPNDEGSSKGIDAGSLCRSPRAAWARCAWLFDRYDCPVLVEEFLPGPEVSIAVLGNGPTAHVIGMMEIAPAQPTSNFIYGFAEKQDWRAQIHYHIPPRLSAATRGVLADRALTAYRVLGCRDVARIDFRLAENGEPCFLECNPLPGLDPHNSDLVIMTRATLPYPELVHAIIRAALRRLRRHSALD